MSLAKVTQGNLFKIVTALTENGSAYADLGAADLVRCKLVSKNKQTVLEADSDGGNVTLDDPALGSVSWQLTSNQTALLPLGVYDFAIQSEQSGNIIEWVESGSIEIVYGLI